MVHGVGKARRVWPLCDLPDYSGNHCVVLRLEARGIRSLRLFLCTVRNACHPKRVRCAKNHSCSPRRLIDSLACVTFNPLFFTRGEPCARSCPTVVIVISILLTRPAASFSLRSSPPLCCSHGRMDRKRIRSKLQKNFADGLSNTNARAWPNHLRVSPPTARSCPACSKSVRPVLQPKASGTQRKSSSLR